MVDGIEMESTRKQSILIGDSMGVNFCSLMDTCEVLRHVPHYGDWHNASMIAGHEERKVDCVRCDKVKYESRNKFLGEANQIYRKMREWT